MSNNYNKIARVYDVISYVVYQNAIKKAQVFLLQFINVNNKVLVVGGGTGWILEEISKLHKENISVVYVEKSAAMIALAKKKNYKNIRVEFINAALEDYASTEAFDVVITPFFFDCFKADKIQLFFAKLDAALKQDGLWLYADFINNKSKLWQQLLLKTMYLFFRFTTGIETQELINVQPYFDNKYTLLEEQFYYRHFIQSKVYRKSFA